MSEKCPYCKWWEKPLKELKEWEKAECLIIKGWCCSYCEFFEEESK